MEYNEVLKSLIEFTNTKLIVLAGSLGYDISYISKWANGAKIPAVKTIYEINKKMSVIFADSIFENGLIKDFYNKYDEVIPTNSDFESRDFIISEITKMLNKGYNQSSPNKIYTEEEMSTYFKLGHINILEEIETILKKVFYDKSNRTYEIYTSLNMLSKNGDRILYLLNKIKSDSQNILIKIGVSFLQEKDKYENELDRIFSTLSKYEDLNIEIYRNDEFKNMNFFIIKNHLFLSYTMDNNENFLTMTYGYDKQTIFNYINYVYDIFNRKNLVLEIIDSDIVAKSNYRTSFYTSDKFSFISNFGFEFLLPSEIVNKISQKAFFETGNKDAALEIKKLEVTWEEIFEKANIDFIITKSALFKYLETGDIVYCSTKYKLSAQERQKHYEYVIKCMKNNPNIRFFLIDNYNPKGSKLKNKFNIFYNNTSLYIKNNVLGAKSQGSVISIFRDRNILSYAKDEIEALKNSKYTTQSGIEEVRSLYKKYWKMFSRIQEIEK